MRAAMLQRRIDKERKRKVQEQEREEARRREAVHKMNAGMAKVFREYILRKTEEMKTEQAQNQTMGKEALKAKLAKWQKLVDADKKGRGGEENDAWFLASKQDEELKLAEDKTKQVLEQ